MNKILYIGPVDMRLGPGIKNISTINYLKKEYDVDIINTYLQGVKRNVLNVLRFILSKNNTIIAVSTGGRKVLLPLAYLKKKIFPKFEYAVIVINGYIIKEFTTKNKIRNFFIRKGLEHSNKVFVELEGLKKKLTNCYNIKNVICFPNFKEDKYFINYDETNNSKEHNNKFKCAFLARVTTVKGIDLAIEAINELNKKGNKIYFDIFGPVDDDAKQWIDTIKNNKFINYKGNIDNKLVTRTLKNYNLFLFPTRHKREGFPASIIDAYSAALPVIASDISYNSEIVINDINGCLCRFNSKSSLVKCIEKYIDNYTLVKKIGNNNFNKAQQYRSSIIFSKFIEEIKEMGW